MDLRSRPEEVCQRSCGGPNRNLETGTYNLDKARKLVEESGIPKDKLKLTMSYNSVIRSDAQYCEMLQAALGKIGVELKLEGAPFFVHWTKAKKLATAPNLYTTIWYALYRSPNTYLGIPFKTSRGPVIWNISHYSNPAFDKLYDEAVLMEGIDQAKAAEIYRKAQKILVDEKVAIFAGDIVDTVVKRKSLKGFEQNTNYTYFFFHDMYRE